MKKYKIIKRGDNYFLFKRFLLIFWVYETHSSRFVEVEKRATKDILIKYL